MKTPFLADVPFSVHQAACSATSNSIPTCSEPINKKVGGVKISVNTIYKLNVAAMVAKNTLTF